MRDVQRQRRLIERADADVDPGGAPAERVPSIRTDHEPASQRLPLPATDRGVHVRGLDGLRIVVDPDQGRALQHLRLERLDQHAVFDVVAEGVEADLAAIEADFGRADQPAAVVDKAHDAERRSLIAARLPYAETVQDFDRRVQQRGGAIVAIGRAAGDQCGSRAGSGSGECRGQTGRTAADDGNVKFMRRGLCRHIHVEYSYSCGRAVSTAPIT